MKRVIALTLSLMIVVCGLSPTTAYAAGGCAHNYDRGFESGNESDICTKCGQIRPNINAPYELPFITREDSVVARKEPRQSSEVVKTYELGTRIRVVARVRNEFDNMWLKLSDGSYMFSDRAAFDFDSMASYALNMVNRSGGVVCYPSWYGLSMSCSRSLAGTLGAMLKHFKSGGTFDLKLRNRLGLNTYDYYVYANGVFQGERFTGEELGNILYGYTCRSVGISSNYAIRFAGLADSSKPSDTVACLFLNNQSRCDDKDDMGMIKFGWNRFRYGNGGYAGGGGGGGAW